MLQAVEPEMMVVVMVMMMVVVMKMKAAESAGGHVSSLGVGRHGQERQRRDQCE
jgi:hypothetical protein